ncbi:MAG: hypothetical protein CME68_10575 [Halobacteriovoraceae bacterium]|nr:hypothetical protein [Halobacteriovoraceae bacterium]|tara:strand:- start:50 stop:1540 length:1491 start_codon:yes stop_codon:yes gene_type:complete
MSTSGQQAIYKPKILLLDDDNIILKATEKSLKGLNAEIDTLNSGKAGLELLKENPNSYALVFIDYRFTNEDGKILYKGDAIAKEMKKIAPDLVVIIMSGDTSDEALKSWLNAGIDNFVYKPVSKKHLIILAESAIEKFNRNRKTLTDVKNIDDSSNDFIEEVGMVGVSNSLLNTAKNIIKFSKSDLPILLIGETGTGKELGAKAIHQNSTRFRKKFLTVNCSTFKGDSTLLESELFGHEKGSFTGALNRKIGIFEEANGGTVFLDEIHHLSIEAQAKILRAIQEKKIRRVGQNEEIPVNFRLISATKPDIRNLCEQNRFLPDLYFRISTLDITISPLRERTEDIGPLIFNFKKKIEKRDGIIKEVSEAAIDKLKGYDWPGNVRELQNFIEKIFLITDCKFIKACDLDHELSKLRSDQNKREKNEIKTYKTLKELEKWYDSKKVKIILETLIKTGHNISKTAEILEEKRSTLSSTIKKYGILDMTIKQREDYLSSFN